MDLILWRHAEAQDPEGMMTDLDRPLTRRGDKQATRMAAWLDRQLPEGTRILCSPAIRTEQTVLALGRKYKLHDELRYDSLEALTAGIARDCEAAQAWLAAPARG